jgi:hypothetical protein
LDLASGLIDDSRKRAARIQTTEQPHTERLAGALPYKHGRRTEKEADTIWVKSKARTH